VDGSDRPGGAKTILRAALEAIGIVQALLAVPVLYTDETIRQKTGGVCGSFMYGESSTTVSESYY
jgi:hypothetical protein